MYGFLLIGELTRLSAHDAPVEQIVRMSVQPSGSQIAISIVVPSPLLADANLPKTADGYLRLDEIEPALRLVAADVANSLAVEQDDAALAVRSARARLVAANPSDSRVFWTQASVDVELMFDGAPRIGRLSARMNTFPSRGETVRTIVAYEPSAGESRTFSLAGAPERVIFDPDRADVAQDFAQRSFRALLANGDWALFLIALLVPWRARGDLLPVVVALVAAQAAGILAGAGWGTASAEGRIAVQLVASSAVIVAALQSIASTSLRRRWPVAAGFGFLAGYSLGRLLDDAVMFAGSHAGIALVMYELVATIGLIWAATVAWTALGLADRLGLPSRSGTIVVSAIVVHSAVHEVMERADLLAQAGVMTAAHAVGTLALGWSVLILGLGIYDGIRGAGGAALASADNRSI